MELGWNIFPWVAAAVFALSLTSAVTALRNHERSGIAIACGATAIALFMLFIATLWVTLERPPLRTMGETRLWYSLFLLMAGLFTYVRWQFRWILSFSTLLATVFMVINILKPEIHDQTLMPALQSVWFVPHVSVYMFSYALLGCATILAIGALISRSDKLDNAIERLLYGGVAFVTIGMLSGAIWAKDAWGAYWSWDAKEAWAAVTWGLYLVAIHLALRPSTYTSAWQKRTYYIVIIAAFLALQMCWWGVNYLPTATASVHTYNQ
jgi:ABC-type transport system involved in cytochrome c biogenesis permease subunit